VIFKLIFRLVFRLIFRLVLRLVFGVVFWLILFFYKMIFDHQSELFINFLIGDQIFG